MARDVSTLSTTYRLFYSTPTFVKNPEMPPVQFRDELFNSRKLRVGFFTSLPAVCESVPAMKRGVGIAKAVLENKGHRLVPFKIPSPELAYLLKCETFVADGEVDTRDLLNADVEISYPNEHFQKAHLPRPYLKLMKWWLKDAEDIPTKAQLATIPKDDPHELNELLRKVKNYRKMLLETMADNGLDAILGPAFACPATDLDSPRDIFSAATYTGMYNFLNWPAGVVPVTQVNANDQVR